MTPLGPGTGSHLHCRLSAVVACGGPRTCGRFGVARGPAVWSRLGGAWVPRARERAVGIDTWVSYCSGHAVDRFADVPLPP